MNARHKLRDLDGQRFRVKATVERFGTKRGWKGRVDQTLLLTDVTDAANGNPLTDHLWMKAGVWSKGLNPGDVIAFDARVDAYLKGYLGRRENIYAPPSRDWHLEFPSKVVRLLMPAPCPLLDRGHDAPGEAPAQHHGILL